MLIITRTRWATVFARTDSSATVTLSRVVALSGALPDARDRPRNAELPTCLLDC